MCYGYNSLVFFTIASFQINYLPAYLLNKSYSFMATVDFPALCFTAGILTACVTVPSATLQTSLSSFSYEISKWVQASTRNIAGILPVQLSWLSFSSHGSIAKKRYLYTLLVSVPLCSPRTLFLSDSSPCLLPP